MIITGVVNAVDAFDEFLVVDSAGGDYAVVTTSGFLLFLFFFFLLVVADFVYELACSIWITVSNVCLLAGGEFHSLFLLFFATTAFEAGSGGLDKHVLSLGLLVDKLDQDLFKHSFTHRQLEQSLSAAWQMYFLFVQVDWDMQVQHESPCFCVAGGTLILSPFGFEKSRID